MNLINYLKTHKVPIPLNIGHWINKVPFDYRPVIGTDYRKIKKEILSYERMSQIEQRIFILNKFKQIFTFAYENIPFYSEIYRDSGVRPEDLNVFEDIEQVPIITKSLLNSVPIEERSFPVKNRLLVNTGGSSGKPFNFYLDPQRYAVEWAHLHHMWRPLGYNSGSLKLTFDGRSNVAKGVDYDFARNSLRVDIYADKFKIAKKIHTITKKNRIEFLHGYPSAISDFALHCLNNEPELRQVLSSQLNAIILSSEFPSPHYRDIIESCFQTKTYSFYGHTETCILAGENNNQSNNTYYPLQSYGFAEITKIEDDNLLVGTSYYNYASPLIRYNTEDSAKIVEEDNNLLIAFEIEKGRTGEFVLDSKNNKIPLTGLIFGRHHSIFNVCKHIQVTQRKPGHVTILFVSKNDNVITNASSLFDNSNVDIEFEFTQVKEPIPSESGKINLLVKKYD